MTGPDAPDVTFDSGDTFFRALHPKFHFSDAGDVLPAAFAQSSDGTGMSVDWSKLCTASETLSRFVHRWSKYGKVDRVAELTADLIWSHNHRITYYPVRGNDAHCLVTPESNMTENEEDEARVVFAREVAVIYL